MKTAFYITFILLIGAILYIVKLSGVVTDQGIEITECTAELDSTTDQLNAILGAGGFDPVDDLPNDKVNEYKNNFERIANGEFDGITGGVISKSAMLDIIRSTGSNGAIAYQICADTAAAERNANPEHPKGLFVVFSPVTMTLNTSTNQWDAADVPGSKNYYSRNWCPPVCCRLP